MLSQTMYNAKISLIFIACLNVGSFSLAYENDGVTQEVNSFALVQYKEDGEKKWELNGRKAEIKEEENISIDNISALMFGERSALKLKAQKGSFNRREKLACFRNNVVAKTTDGIRLATDSLYWNRDTNSVFTEDMVNIKQVDFEVDGKGAVCDLENKTAELKKEISASIASSDTAFLRTASDGLRTTITCDGPLEIDYRKNRARFRNNVKVEDGEGSIFADSLYVYFNKDTRRIRCVVAKGDVKIVNAGSVTYSEKAVYLVERGRVIFPRKPKLVIGRENVE